MKAMTVEQEDTKAKGEGVTYKRKPGRRLPSARRSLAFVLTSMQGQEVVVELKNDSEVRGVVEESDRGMNISMRNVRQVDANGTVAEFDFLVVNGPSIRYVHISPFLNVSSHITSHIRRLDHISKHTGPHKIVDRPKAAAAPIST